jgi:hypothetical protein
VVWHALFVSQHPEQVVGQSVLVSFASEASSDASSDGASPWLGASCAASGWSCVTSRLPSIGAESPPPPESELPLLEPDPLLDPELPPVSVPVWSALPLEADERRSCNGRCVKSRAP